MVMLVKEFAQRNTQHKSKKHLLWLLLLRIKEHTHPLTHAAHKSQKETSTLDRMSGCASVSVLASVQQPFFFRIV